MAAPKLSSSQVKLEPDLAYSLATVESRVNALVAPKGPWDRLVAANKALVSVVNPLIKGSKSHHEDFDSEKLEALLTGHHGLEDEFANGPQTIIHNNFNEGYFVGKKSLADRLSILIKSFSDRSQLCKFERTNQQTDEENVRLLAENQNKQPSELDIPPYHNMLEDLGIKKTDEEGYLLETRLEAFARCASEIEKWTKLNRRGFGKETADTIQKAVVAYREALQEVQPYVEYLQDYAAHERGKRVVPPSMGPTPE